MSIMMQLTQIAVRYVGGASGEQAVNFLIERFTDQSQRLPKALNAATERAWKTLELTLAGDSLWSKLTTRAEDQALAQELRLALVVINVDQSVGNKGEFFRAALKELRSTRRSPVQPDELRQHRRAMVNYADPVALAEAEWHATDAMADECDRSGNKNLAKFLRLRASDLPFLTVAVRYYFRRAVEEDRELFQGLAFAKLEAASTAQEQQFATLAQTLDRHAARLEGMLADVLEDVGFIRENMASKSDVARVEGLLLQILAQQGMARTREVSSRHSMSIRTDSDRRDANEAIRDYRSLPDDVRRAHPSLIESAAKVQFAIGDFEQAQASFLELPQLLDNKQAQAQAHFNAYRAALERAGRSGNKGDWETALKELIRAVNLDRKYLPFDARKYSPSRILGAGGFGVTFLCKHKELDDYVAVKALIAEELELDAEKVFGEGRLLRKIDHPAIIRMQDCGFADPDAQARPFLVMDFFEGQTLEAYVATNGTLSLEDGITLAKLLADGMKAAHGQGVLHRDLKPANIMVRKELGGWKAKIIDFGLALKRETVEAAAGVSTSQRGKTLAGSSLAGTVDYAAPEQMGKLPGVPVGPYSDVYGWGKTVCYALFKTPTPGSRLYKANAVPDSLRELLEACQDEEPPHRPQTFTDVLRRLALVEDELNPALEFIEDAPTKPAVVQWYYTKSGQRHGPVIEPELKSLLAAGTVGPDDMVWRNGLPNWTTARSVEGLMPKAATTGVKVRFYCPPVRQEEGLLGMFGNHMMKLTAGREAFKVHVDGKHRCEANRMDGFDLTFEVGPGKHKVEVVWWSLLFNKEQDRKPFEMTFVKTGDYEIRFNFVGSGGFSNHMQDSTVEVLKEPG
jgi:serine/threonine protein kinase